MIDDLLNQVEETLRVSSYTEYEAGPEVSYGPLELNQAVGIYRRHREFRRYVVNVVSLDNQLKEALEEPKPKTFWSRFKKQETPNIMQIHSDMVSTVADMNVVLSDIIVDSRADYRDINEYVQVLTDSRIALHKVVFDYDFACTTQRGLYADIEKACKAMPEESVDGIKLEQGSRKVQTNLAECEHNLEMYKRKFDDAKKETDRAVVLADKMRRYIHNNEMMLNRSQYLYRHLQNHKNTFALFSVHASASRAMLDAFDALSSYTSEINDLFNEQMKELEKNADVYKELSTRRLNDEIKSFR